MQGTVARRTVMLSGSERTLPAACDGGRGQPTEEHNGDELRTIISLNRSDRELAAITTYRHLGSKCRPSCGSPESLTSPQSSREL